MSSWSQAEQDNQPVFNMTMTDEEADNQLFARRQRSMSSLQRTIERKENQIKKQENKKKSYSVHHFERYTNIVFKR